MSSPRFVDVAIISRGALKTKEEGTTAKSSAEIPELFVHLLGEEEIGEGRQPGSYLRLIVISL